MNKESILSVVCMVVIVLIVLVGLFAGATLEQILQIVLMIFVGILFLWKKMGGRKQ